MVLSSGEMEYCPSEYYHQSHVYTPLNEFCRTFYYIGKIKTLTEPLCLPKFVDLRQPYYCKVPCKDTLPCKGSPPTLANGQNHPSNSLPCKPPTHTHTSRHISCGTGGGRLRAYKVLDSNNRLQLPLFQLDVKRTYMYMVFYSFRA